FRGDDPSYGRGLTGPRRDRDDGFDPPSTDEQNRIDLVAIAREADSSTRHIDIAITGDEETTVTLELAPLP
ncbi:MAG: hypothetical protein IT364_26890, partial [Candidatus Hydrogenedentes bacterium]|nr:hypothetical protein [Candidatus Hydrogenedentota bacterium]